MNKSAYLNVEYLITFGIILSQNGNSLYIISYEITFLLFQYLYNMALYRRRYSNKVILF